MRKQSEITKIEEQLRKDHCNFEVQIAITEALESLCYTGFFNFSFFRYKSHYSDSNQNFVMNQIRRVYPNARLNLSKYTITKE